jgi:hypothetical protein
VVGANAIPIPDLILKNQFQRHGRSRWAEAGGAARATRVAKRKEKNRYAVTSAEDKDAIASAVGLS